MATTIQPVSHAQRVHARPVGSRASHSASPAGDSVHVSEDEHDPHGGSHVHAIIAGVRQHASAPSASTQAADAYGPLTHDFGSASDVHQYNRNGERSTLWPYSQDMVAALDKGDYSRFNQLSTNLKRYQASAGYDSASNGHHGQGGEFYDDNSWVGLAYMQAYKQTGKQSYLGDARQEFNYVKTGLYQGGLQWQQGQSPRQWATCSSAPAAELALRLHAAPGNSPQQSQEYLGFAQQIDHNLDAHLRNSNGLYRNNVYPDEPGVHSKQTDAIWSYNQGAAIGMKTLLYQATGNHQYLQQAQQTANASLKYFGQKNRLWKQPPAFNAIFFRNLQQLDNVAPNGKYRSAEDSYANRAWSSARAPLGNLFDRGGVGRSGQPPGGSNMALLDQAGFSQIFSMLAASPRETADLT